MKREHTYSVKLTWTGNKGTGTSSYTAYERNHTVTIENKANLLCSSDPAFRGDKTKINPEEMFLSALSSCHMLWYLHLCANHGIIVVTYVDQAIGLMSENENGDGHFTGVTLHPNVTIVDKKRIEKANGLHEEANKKCFIANSCNFPVIHKPHCISIDQ